MILPPFLSFCSANNNKNYLTSFPDPTSETWIRKDQCDCTKNARERRKMPLKLAGRKVARQLFIFYPLVKVKHIPLGTIAERHKFSYVEKIPLSHFADTTASATTSPSPPSSANDNSGDGDGFWEDLVFCIEDFQFGGE